MRKKILALIATFGAAIMLGLTAVPANAATIEGGHNVGVVVSGAIDWKFTVNWETNYGASIPTTTEPSWLMLCQNGTVGTKKYARSARLTYKNGRTGGIVTRYTYNFGQGPTSTCNTFNVFADARGQTSDIKVSDFPTIDMDFYSGTGLTGTLLGTVRGYEYL